MAIKQDINFSYFTTAFHNCDGRGEQFSYEALRVIFDYLEQLSDEIQEDIELDVIALCCEYAEYESLEELQKDYPDIESMEDLESETNVLLIDGSDSFVIAQY